MVWQPNIRNMPWAFAFGKLRPNPTPGALSSPRPLCRLPLNHGFTTEHHAAHQSTEWCANSVRIWPSFICETSGRILTAAMHVSAFSVVVTQTTIVGHSMYAISGGSDSRRKFLVYYYMRQGLCNGTVFVCPPVRLSVPEIDRCSSVRRVCCCEPGRTEISIDYCTAGAHQQRRRSSTAVSNKCEQCHVYNRRRRLSAN